MMASVLHVTSGLGLRKFQADGFLLTRVYISFQFANSLQKLHVKPECEDKTFNEPGPI